MHDTIRESNMDRENFNAIITRFLDKFEVTNSKPSEEYFKWNAVACFQKNWNLEAADFAQMFSDAVKEFSVIIDTNYAAPVGGLKTLLKQPGEDEIIRAAFKELFAEDAGNIDQLQIRAERFVETVNERIDYYWPGSHLYRQSLRSAVLFLSMRYPADNYILFWSRAANWATFVEFADDFGSGASFSLAKFYRMCDELRDEILKSELLKKCNEERMRAAGVLTDDDYHIMVYDIIYCATCYHLYTDIPNYGANVGERIQRSKDRTEIEKIKQTVAELEAQAKTSATLQKLPPELIGCAVEHKKFGQGIITEKTNTILRVRFGEELKGFLFPDAFEQKHLALADSTIMADMMAAIDSKKASSQVDKALNSAKEELEKIESAFNKKWKKGIHNGELDISDE